MVVRKGMAALTVPKEIKVFFEGSGGRSLLVKGGPGSGKSLFTLQVLNDIFDRTKSIYIPSRVTMKKADAKLKKKSQDSNVYLDMLGLGNYKGEELHDRFPWLQEIEMGTKTAALQPKKTDQAPNPSMSGVFAKFDTREFVDIFNAVDRNLPDRSHIVIDSLEGLVRRYQYEGTDVDVLELAYGLQKELVENRNTNLLVVSEQEDDERLDFILDGVVQLKKCQEEGRITREVELKKIKGLHITRSVYSFTLNRGMFNFFDQYNTPVFTKCGLVCNSCKLFSNGTCTGCDSEVKKRNLKCKIYQMATKKAINVCTPGRDMDEDTFREAEDSCPLLNKEYDHRENRLQLWNTMANTTHRFSTGSSDFDRILGGGYQRGSFNLIEVDPQIPQWGYMPLLYPTMINFIRSQNGVLITSMEELSQQEVARNIIPFTGNDAYSRCLRIVLSYSPREKDENIYYIGADNFQERQSLWRDAFYHFKKHLFNMRFQPSQDDAPEGEEEEYEKELYSSKKAVVRPRFNPGRVPIMDITSLSHLEYLFNRDDVLHLLGWGISKMGETGDLSMGLIKTGSGIAQHVANLATTHFRIKEFNGAFGIYGVKPRTKVHMMNLDFSNGIPNLQLKTME